MQTQPSNATDSQRANHVSFGDQAPIVSQKEKSAGLRSITGIEQAHAREKSRQLSASRDIGKSSKVDGIGFAQSDASMSTTPNPIASTAVHASTRSATDWVVDGLSQISRDFAKQVEAPPAQLSSKAIAFVERVETAVETLKSQSGRVVRISVGESAADRLSISMHLKDGVVQTTIHTATAELREALSKDWSSSVTAAFGSDSGVRVADPVWVNSNKSTSADLDSGNPRHSQQEGHRDHASGDQQSPWSSPRSSTRSDTSLATNRAAPDVHTATVAANSGRHQLQAFA